MVNHFKTAMTQVQNNEWKLWCRLCAKENARNINVIPVTNGASADTNSNCCSIVNFIEEFFRVKMAKDEDHPHWLCTECFSLISNLIYFVDRVQRVQNMYEDMRNYGCSQTLNLLEVREKYNLLGDELFVFQSLDAKPNVENILITPEKMVQKEWEHVMKNNVISVEAQSGIFLGKFECKSEFQDPIGELDENFSRDPIVELNENFSRDPIGELKGNVGSDVENNTDCSNNNKTAEINKSLEKVEANIKKELSLSYNLQKPDKRLKRKQCKSESESIVHKYFCRDCSLNFHRITNYKIHMKKKHEMVDKLVDELVSLTCPQCPRTFKTRWKLSHHIKTHRQLSEKLIFPCPQCDRKFGTKDYVSRHIKFVHEDIRPFICEECGEGTRTEATLREHMLIHTDFAPFECEICKKAFKNQSRLKNHMDIHSSNKYMCSECGLQLNSRETLNRHMLVHSDVMRHKCDYCGRAFKRAKTLKSHLILHSGLKPYSCDFCDKTFADGSNCRSHKRKSHPEELAALEASGEKTYTKNIPKLCILKTVTKSAKNLIPVVSKQNSNFSLGRKPNRSSNLIIGTKQSSMTEVESSTYAMPASNSSF